MQTAIIFLSSAVAVIIMFVYFFKKGRVKKIKPNQINPSTGLMTNDRIIIARNVTAADMSNAINGFASIYEEEINFSAISTVQVAADEFAITFPYGINFELFCNAVDFVDGQFSDFPGVFVRGWATITAKEMKIPENQISQKVMVYISGNEDEFVNVHFVTAENVGYRYVFSAENYCFLLSEPDKNYAIPPMLMADLPQLKIGNHWF